MYRRTLAVVMATGAVVGLTGPTPAVAGPGQGRLQMANVVLFESYECDDYSYSYNFELPDGADSWSIDTDLLDHRTGMSIAEDFDYDDVTSNSVAGQSTLMICSGRKATAELAAVVTFVDYESGYEDSFTLPVKIVKIRPPLTKTSLRDVTAIGPGNRGRYYVSGVANIRVERPRGFFPASGFKACLQVRDPARVKSKWTKLRGSCATTDKKGRGYIGGQLSIKKPMLVRAFTPTDLEYNLGSASQSMRVRR